MAVKFKHYVNSYDSVDRIEYYQRFVFPERMSLFSDIWKSSKSLMPENTEVVFRTIKFGSEPEAVAAILGKPRFVIENHGLSSLIYFYKEQVNNHRMITQIHFWGKEFFYAGYTFRDESDTERKKIKDVLFDKYAVPGSSHLERQEHLEDKQGNIISLQDSVNFNIIYLWGHEKIKNAFSQNTYSLRFGKETEKKREFEELRSKL